jgi:fructokinase
MQRTSRAPVFLDLNVRTDVLQDVSLDTVMGHPAIVKVNLDELRILLDWHGAASLPSSDDGALQTHRKELAGLIARIGAETMIVTLGADGAIALDCDGVCIVREAGVRPPALADTVGAGDAFASVILLGHLLGWPLERSMKRATAFSAAICTIPGAVPAHLDFYESWRRSWSIDVGR